MSTPVSPQQSPSPEERNRDVMTSTSAMQASAGTIATASVVAVPVTDTGVVAGRLRDTWRMMTRNPKVAVGLGIVVFFLLVAIFGPLLVRTPPYAFSSDTLVPPSSTHWLGTTQTGQDVFTQVIDGARVSMFVGFIAGILSTLISITFGLTAGYFGGTVDDILSVLINVFLVLPGLPLAIVLADFFPIKGPVPIAFVLTITSWAWGARVLRAQTLSMRNRDFVEAARASGEGTARIIFAEILPNMIAIVATGFIGTVIYIILAEAGLEYLGLGDTTVVSWGTMFYWAQNNDALLLGAWWWFLPPGFCIAAVGAGLAFINFGIDEIANPRLRSEARPKQPKVAKGAAASSVTGIKSSLVRKEIA